MLALALPARAEPQTLEDATLAVPAFSLAFSLTYIATDLHLWEKHGVRVGLRDIAGLGAINAVISGSIELALASGLSLTRAAAHDQRLLAIAMTLGRPVSQIALRKSFAEAAGFDPKAPLEQRALALKGRTLAVGGINSIQHAYVRVLASRAGFDPESITVAAMAPGSMLAAFETRQVDGIVEAAPWPEQPVLDGTGVMIASGPDGDPPDMVPFANTVVVTRPETCAARPALCEGVGRTLADAAEFAEAQPEAALAVLQKRFPRFDGKLMAASFAAIRRMTPHPPAPDTASLENAELFNIEAGLMKPAEKLKSYDGLLTDRYVR